MSNSIKIIIFFITCLKFSGLAYAEQKILNARAQLMRPASATNTIKIAIERPNGMPPAPTQTAQPPVQTTVCSEKIIRGVLETCCKKCVYSPFHNCTNYCFDVHLSCQNEKINCKSIGLKCGDLAHALNMYQRSDGLWCLIDATNNPGGTGKPRELGCTTRDPPAFTPGQYCEALGKPPTDPICLNCELVTWNDPEFPNSGTGACAREENKVPPTSPLKPGTPISQDPERLNSCKNCCEMFTKYYKDNEIPRWKEWLRSCQYECNHIPGPPSKI